MGLLDLQECELDDEMEAPAAVERERAALVAPAPLAPGLGVVELRLDGRVVRVGRQLQKLVPRRDEVDVDLLLADREFHELERRDVEGSKDFRTYMYPGGVCEFDGRLSATVFRGRLHLFARANVRMGIRAVQHTSVDVTAFSSGKVPLPWSRWEPVEFASYSFKYYKSSPHHVVSLDRIGLFVAHAQFFAQRARQFL